MISYCIDIFCDGLECHKRIALTDIDRAEDVSTKAGPFMVSRGWRFFGRQHYCPDCSYKKAKGELLPRLEER